jgi:hypothetical protein
MDQYSKTRGTMNDNSNRFETVSPESPCTKCGAITDKDRLNCKGCGESILHGQEHFYAGDGEHESDTFCLCERCDEFGPPSEEEIPFVRQLGPEPTTECRDLPGQHQNGDFLKPTPAVVARLSALWKDGINFQQGWAALLAGFTPSNTYVARLGDRVEMVAEFPDAEEAVRFTVHLENLTGAKASLERTTIN